MGEGEADARLVMQQAMMDFVPHNKALGLALLGVTLEPAAVVLRLPWDERLVGNPLTGVLHGGAITALIDAACGGAVYARLREPLPIATLDLRIDYLKPGVPREAVMARAECFRTTRNVAFVRAVAYQRDEADLVASAAGTFMLGTAGGAVAAQGAGGPR